MRSVCGHLICRFPVGSYAGHSLSDSALAPAVKKKNFGLWHSGHNAGCLLCTTLGDGKKWIDSIRCPPLEFRNARLLNVTGRFAYLHTFTDGISASNRPLGRIRAEKIPQVVRTSLINNTTRGPWYNARHTREPTDGRENQSPQSEGENTRAHGKGLGVEAGGGKRTKAYFPRHIGRHA